MDKVNVKTYGYHVVVSRQFMGMPIFNSLATVDIDPSTGEVIAFDLNNWSPSVLDKNDNTLIDEISNQKIKDKILKKLSKYEDSADG